MRCRSTETRSGIWRFLFCIVDDDLAGDRMLEILLRLHRRRWLLSLLIKIKRKLKRKGKRKRKRGNLRGGREPPPRRLLHPLRFCFRCRFDLL